MKKIELLAPAKDLRTACAAIDSGADAVYMGGPSLGARAAATNSLEDVRAAAEYAHLFGARLYLTLNTIVYEHEIAEARRIAQQAIDAGVDALIIQDPAYLRMGIVGAEWHASTQLYNATPEGVAFLGGAGFSRVVLERGLTREEVKSICEATDAEIEVFVHGAICVCGSGRCYMSRSQSHRSGNRGECSQPCRQTYDLVDGNGKIVRKGAHLLSVRDMDMSAHVGELLDMGVVSFKIEGRLKDEAYVRNITAHYNRLLNEALAKRPHLTRASQGTSTIDFTPLPAKTFTRNGGPYVFGGKRAGLATFDTPKAMGEPLGKVKEIGRGWFALDRKVELHAGDGVCYTHEGQLYGTNINSVEGGRIRPNRMEALTVGAQLFRNHDKAFHDTLASTRTRRSLPLWFSLSGDTEGITLTAHDKSGNTAQASIAQHFDTAAKPDTALANIRTSLAKSGGSPFDIEGVEIDFVGAVPFLPTSLLNSLRRDVLESMERTLRATQPQKNIATENTSLPYPTTTLRGDHNVVNSLSRKFYTDHGVEHIDEGYDTLPDLTGVEVMLTPYCIRREIGQCLLKGSSLREPLTLRHGEDEYRLRFDCKRCMMYVVKS